MDCTLHISSYGLSSLLFSQIFLINMHYNIRIMGKVAQYFLWNIFFLLHQNGNNLFLILETQVYLYVTLCIGYNL